MVEYGRRPDEMSRVYSNFVHVLRPGERPEDAAPLFRVYSGMDLDYWQRYYLLGRGRGGRGPDPRPRSRRWAASTTSS